MGFDITAMDETGNEVADHRVYMGGFRMMYEQGYNWFELIDAMDCYGGVSGTGESKLIMKRDLIKARDILKDFKVTKLSEDRDEISDRRESLCEFMQKCIDWCEKEQKDSIMIEFC